MAREWLIRLWSFGLVSPVATASPSAGVAVNCPSRRPRARRFACEQASSKATTEIDDRATVRALVRALV